MSEEKANSLSCIIVLSVSTNPGTPRIISSSNIGLVIIELDIKSQKDMHQQTDLVEVRFKQLRHENLFVGTAENGSFEVSEDCAACLLREMAIAR